MLYGLGAGNHFPYGGMISLWKHHFDAVDKYTEDGRAVKSFLFRQGRQAPAA